MTGNECRNAHAQYADHKQSVVCYDLVLFSFKCV